MKEFDLIAAQRGDPIQITFSGTPSSASQWASVRFIGITSIGSIVYESPDRSVDTARPIRVRMAPRKRTVYANLMIDGAAAWFNTPNAAEVATHTYKVIARAVPVEIEE